MTSTNVLDTALATKRPSSLNPVQLELLSPYQSWLGRFADPCDWAFFSRKKGIVANCSNETLSALRRGEKVHHFSRFNKSAVAGHLFGSDLVYVRPRRSQPNGKPVLSLVRIDIDEHDGQSDGWWVAEFFADAVFPGSFASRSKRGASVWFFVDVGRCPRGRFNEILQDLPTALSATARNAGYRVRLPGEKVDRRSDKPWVSLEVQGKFCLLDENKDVTHRPSAVLLPAPLDLEEMRRLENLPVLTVAALESLVDDWEMPVDVGIERAFVQASAQAACDLNSAWDRMVACCYTLARRLGRVPDVEELLIQYQRDYDTHAADEPRCRRAADVIGYCGKTFDILLAGESYKSREPELLKMVREHCKDRRCNYKSAITDVDLSIALFAFERSSFEVKEDADRQWTCPLKAIKGMFVKLKPQTGRGGSNPNKISGCKAILLRSGLAEMQDRGYRVGGKKHGAGQKVTIGPNHQRYADLCRFGETVRVRYFAEAEALVGGHDTQSLEGVCESVGDVERQVGEDALIRGTERKAA